MLTQSLGWGDCPRWDEQPEQSVRLVWLGPAGSKQLVPESQCQGRPTVLPAWCTEGGMCQGPNGGGNRSLFEKGVSTRFADRCPDPGAPKVSPGMWARVGDAVVSNAGKGQCPGRGSVCPVQGGRGKGPCQPCQGGRWTAPGFAADPTLPRAQRTERRAPKKMGSSAMSRRLP